MIRWVVLGLLRSGDRLHGYALARAHRQLTGSQLNSGNLYRELQRLVAEGLVRPAEKVPEGDPRRLVYEITGAGTEEFDSWFARLRDTGAAIGEDDLSLRTVFVAQVEPSLGRRLLERSRDELWFQSQVLERERSAELLRCKAGNPRVFPARANLLGRRLRHVVADLEFLDELKRTYESWLSDADVRAALAAGETATAAMETDRRRGRGGRRR